MDLSNCTYQNTQDYFDLIGFEGIGKVVKVYDGDTFWIAIDPQRRLKVRLEKINCPEIKLKNIKGGTPEQIEKAKQEKIAGLAAKEFVKNLIEGQMVKYKIIGEGGFGRPLASVSYGLYYENNLADKILGAGHAVIYEKK